MNSYYMFIVFLLLLNNTNTLYNVCNWEGKNVTKQVKLNPFGEMVLDMYEHKLKSQKKKG